MDELLKEGFITKEHGKGSRVIERRKSLGFLTVKGFSGAIDYDVATILTEKPKITQWDPIITFLLTEEEKNHSVSNINDCAISTIIPLY